jgi:hypothetical protein
MQKVPEKRGVNQAVVCMQDVTGGQPCGGMYAGRYRLQVAENEEKEEEEKKKKIHMTRY